MISGDKEILRLTHEKEVLNVIEPLLYFSKVYDDLSNVDKYKEYMLAFINKKFDKDLYDICKKLYQLEWNPSAYQKAAEHHMISEIEDTRNFFGVIDTPIYVTDILLNLANRMYNKMSRISFASLLEILLTNIGVYPDPGEWYIVKECWNDCCKSDELPGQVTMFDQPTYDRLAYEGIDGKYYIPSWIEQCDLYIDILDPLCWNLDSREK